MCSITFYEDFCLACSAQFNKFDEKLVMDDSIIVHILSAINSNEINALLIQCDEVPN